MKDIVFPPVTRRQFLGRSAVVSTSALLVSHRSANPILRQEERAADIREVIAAALDAARRGGASYADVQIRSARREDWFFPGVTFAPPEESQSAGIGVRALVQGCWGFVACDGVVSVDHAATLGRDAARQGTIASRGRSRPIVFAPIPAPAVGEWTMPVAIDPFTVSAAEKVDFLTATLDDMQRQRFGVNVNGYLTFVKERRTFGSSDGAFVVQTVYNTSGDVEVNVGPDWKTGVYGWLASDFLTPAGAGWEYIRQAPYREETARMIALARGSRRPVPVDVGRYDIVFDAAAAAMLVDQSVGAATELDRVMGDVANTVGTSYITDPDTMLQHFRIGSPLLTVRATRALPAGAATVRWDDEGIEPVDTSLVTNGVLTDMQTTRESAGWMAASYQRLGRPVRSNGCAGVYAATEPVTTRSPNFILQPGPHDIAFDDLVKSTRRGVAILGGFTRTDYQALNGYGRGALAYTITNGTLGRPVIGAGFTYRSPEFWKGLTALGGARSVRAFGQTRQRERVTVGTRHTVQAVPLTVANVSVMDIMRKA